MGSRGIADHVEEQIKHPSTTHWGVFYDKLLHPYPIPSLSLPMKKEAVVMALICRLPQCYCPASLRSNLRAASASSPVLG